MTNPYPAEFRERALRMLTEARPDHPSDFAAASHVAGRLGVNPETLRLWKKRAELEKANAILRSASVFFATGLVRTSSR